MHYLTKCEIMNIIKQLAKCQGYYSSLKRNIDECDEETKNEFLGILESQHFKDEVDLVLYLEA